MKSGFYNKQINESVLLSLVFNHSGYDLFLFFFGVMQRDYDMCFFFLQEDI